MSNYDRLLEEAKKQGANLAKNYVPELYKILVEEEKLDPKDAGDRVKKDLVLIWSIQTINKNLPEEAKHTEKDHSNNDIEESVKPVSQIVMEQSTSGTTLPSTTVPDFEPVTDEDSNDQFGKGVVPMTNDNEEKPILNLQTQNVRMVMSNTKFHALIRHMADFYEQNKTTAKRYVIEYDPQEKELYVDVAEEGEERNIDG